MTSSTFQQAFRHHQAGRLQQAEAGYREVLAVEPAHTDSLHLLGVIALQIGQFSLAVEVIGKAIALQPFVADFHNNLGLALTGLDRLKEAERSYREAIRLKPDYPEARNNLGNALKDLGRIEDAERAYLAALRLKPDYAAAHNNLGTIHAARGRLEEAAACYRAALRLDPNYPEAYHNLANAVRGLGHWDETGIYCREALRLDPNYAEAHYNLGWWLLLTGQFEEGWREFEWRGRLKARHAPRRFTQPLWNGEDLGDRVLLLHAEQGAGDTFQFCRYVPLAAARGRVVLEAPRPLLRLLTGLPGIEHIVAAGDALPPFDLQCPLLSLPRAFGTTLDTVPAEVPYLKAEPDQVAAWQARLVGLDGLRVGLVWAGNPEQADDDRRSIAFDRFSDLAGVPGVVFVSLQKGDAAALAHARSIGMSVTDWTEELGDYADTAALIETLDLVISVDTGVAHLAGALGKPVWLLNRFDPYFVWLLNREDSPWYPTLRQFRQPVPGDWDSVVARVRTELERLCSPQKRLD
jgi:tetratricopeptide (TPR) repeat protein